MKNITKYIFPVLLAVLLFSADAFAQDRARKTLDIILLDAVDNYNSGKYAEAEEMLVDILTVDKSYDAAWYYMGHLAIMREDLARANKCYQMAVELDPMNFWYRLRHAQINRYISDPLAIEMFEKLIEDFPKKSDLYYEMMRLYAMEKEYEKALETHQKIERIFGVTEELTLYGYRIYYAMGKLEDGIEYLRRYNEKYSSPDVLTILAEYEIDMYNDTVALKYYDEALELDPTFPLALYGKAETFRVARRYEEYFPALDKYVESPFVSASDKTGYLEVVVKKSDPRFVKKYVNQIDTTLLKLAQTHPGDSSVYSLRGQFFYYTGRFDDAQEQFHDCALAFPEKYGPTADYIDFLMAVGKWKEAADEGYKAFKRFPDILGFLELTRIAEYNLGNYNKVLDICTEMLILAPNDTAVALASWSVMGDVYYILGDSKNAYRAYDNALKIDPENLYVLNNYAYYLSVEGRDLKKAYQMSQKTVMAEPENATYLDTFGWILYLRGDYVEAKSFFKQAMLYGGKDSSVILDHYADVLFALKEYDLAFVYWNLATRKNANDEVPFLNEKVEKKKKEVRR